MTIKMKIIISLISLCLFACSDDWSKEETEEIVKQCQNDDMETEACKCIAKEISSITTYVKWKSLNEKDINSLSEENKKLLNRMSDILLSCTKK